MRREEVLSCLRKHSAEIRDHLGVKTLAVFGSVARDDDHSDSDVDVLVDFNGKATFDQYMDLKLYLEDILGRPVDLVTRRALRPILRERIESEAIHVA
jgi:predicted nucleotidyltransferase